MEMALKEGGLAPEDVGYINAHGTSTKYNDRTETKAIKTAFGDHAFNLCVSSTKSMTGHMVGGCGGVEAMACLKVQLKQELFLQQLIMRNLILNVTSIMCQTKHVKRKLM